MIDATLIWSEENIKQYVKYTMLEKTKNTKLYMTLYLISMVLIAVISCVTAIVTGMLWLFAATVFAVLLIVFFVFILFFAVKKYTNEIFEINKGSTFDGIEITATCFCLKRNGELAGKLEWEVIESADFYNDYVFLMTMQGFLIIISKEDIKTGSIKELKRIIDEKMVKQVE